MTRVVGRLELVEGNDDSSFDANGGFAIVAVDSGVVQATEDARAWVAGSRRAALLRFVCAHDAGGPARGRIEGIEVVCERLVGVGLGRYLVQLTPRSLGASALTPRLTPRQREVAALAARGATAREIAEHLGIGTYTVKQHLAAVYERMGVSSRLELALAWRSDGDAFGE